MADQSVTIKGTNNGLLISLGAGDWDSIELALFKIIRSRSDFFRGAEVALQVGDRVLERDEIRKLRDKLAEHDVRLKAILGDSAETVRSARRLDLETEIPETRQAGSVDDDTGDLPPISADETGSAGVLIRHTLRNGRTLRHVGHVVVIGDVNPGAQIIAGGDVLIWGRLRGIVHAGATGDENAIICALDMRPMQLRIANHVAITPDSRKSRPHPEVAFVRGGANRCRRVGK